MNARFSTSVVSIFLMVMLVVSFVPVGAQEGEIPLEGHFIEGDALTFVFDPAFYGVDAFEAVAVKGNFNDYNADTPGWQLSDNDDDGVWTLQVPLGVGIKAGTPFRFVINGNEGVVLEPPAGVDPDYLVADNEGNNLLVVGGLESFLANDSIASPMERQTFVDEDGGERGCRIFCVNGMDERS